MNNSKSLDWDSIKQNAGGSYKNYAADGDYTVKVAEASVRKASTGTAFLELSFEDTDEYQFPKISHALSFKNDSWRQWHFMNMLKELGISEDKAKAAIESCEGKSSQDAKVSAYEQTFKRAAAKHPEISIEVFTEEGSNGKAYARADFKNRNIAFGKKDSQPAPAKQETILDQAEDISDSSLDLPF